MRIPITIPDDLLATLISESDERRLPFDAIVAERLTTGLALPSNTRAIVVSGEALAALEAKLGHGQLASAEDLVTKVDRLAKIEFGEYEITLTPAQREEIAWRANKQGRSVEQMVKLIWQRMQDQFFSMVP